MEDRAVEFAAKDAAEVFVVLGSGPRGLDAATAALRLRSAGTNTVALRQVRPFAVFLRQFKSSFVILLVVAAGIAFGLGEETDALLIALFVAINTVLGFVQEYRAERALSLMRALIPRKTHVRRDGKETLIEATHVVPGDVVILKAGDQAPADLRLVKAVGVQVDESTLSGESIPVPKDAEPDPGPSSTFMYRNVVYSGTAIVGGEGEGVVFATGGRTMMGGLAKVAAEEVRHSRLSRGLAGFSRFILLLTAGTLAIVFVLRALMQPETFSVAEYLVFSIALAVGVIPEALPFVITLALSAGGMRLAKKQVVPKRLSAIEDLGSVQVLCTDKTGTITENMLSVSDVYGDRGQVVLAALLGSSFWAREEEQPNNAFDRAAWDAARPADRTSLATWHHVAELPFTPDRRRNTQLIANAKGVHRLIVRGAEESIVPLLKNFSDKERVALEAWTAARGREGKRILCVAERTVPATTRVGDAERDLVLVGALAFHDPLKPDAAPTVARAQASGIQVKILTGDSPEVAGAVAVAVGLVAAPDRVISGERFARMSSEQQLRAVLEEHVFARVTPAQKYEIIHLLKEHAVVGFLGEGVNDAPALTLADVGMVVDRGADVAKDAADIVLLNHSLSVIIDGIMEGRRTFANTIKYIRATLTSNFGNFFALAVASLLVPFLPMLPIQVLLVNLLSDFPLLSISADNVEAADLKRPETYHVRDMILMCIVLGMVSTFFDFIFFVWFLRFGQGPLQTMWWMGSIITELALFYSIRTRLPFWRAGRPSRTVLLMTVLAAGATLIIPFVGRLEGIFHFVRPEPAWVVALVVIAGAYFAASEVLKLAYVRLVGNGNGGIPKT